MYHVKEVIDKQNKMKIKFSYSFGKFMSYDSTNNIAAVFDDDENQFHKPSNGKNNSCVSLPCYQLIQQV